MKPMTLVGMLIGVAIAARADAATPSTQPDVRPNILLAIADDWSWPHAGVYGDKVVKTPTFDRVAREGLLFSRAFCAAPSCTPSRAAILTGQAPHRLEAGGNLHGTLPAKFAVYPDLLEASGYVVGHMGKGWAPGVLGDRKRNPAGPPFKSFEAFLKTVPVGKPFCFWYGSRDPHRPYIQGQGAESGMKAAEVVVPPFLPDAPEVRGDILDYYFAVQRYDHDTGEILKQIESAGRLDNTLVVMTSDNGMPFPRAKTNLYDSGSHMPLAIRWPAKIKAGRKTDAQVSLTDLCPTFVEAAGLKVSSDMTGKSFFAEATGEAKTDREAVFIERERHANVRKGDLGYPVRAIRTGDFLYLRNLRPDLEPAGDPEMWKAVGPYGDIDSGPSKDLILLHKDAAVIADFFQLACGHRPAEELYDLAKDPGQLHNVAEYPEYIAAKKTLRGQLDGWMQTTADPRAIMGGAYEGFDHYPYFGDRKPMPTSLPAAVPARKLPAP